MKLSNKQLELIRPEVLNRNDGIQAWFTCKNAACYGDEQCITGLNLGFNTNEEESVVAQHRRDLLSALGIDEKKIAYAEQVHGNEVRVVEEGGTFQGVDALVTQAPGLVLAIQVADCAAVLLADSRQGIVAAVHAGWRGAAGDILPNTISKMVALGVEPSHLIAFISPCISQQNFEVGSEVAEKFPAEFVDLQNYKKPHVDLKGFLRHQLLVQGLNSEAIEVHEGCTVDDSRQFYSYRREQQESGRMLGLIRYEGIGE